MCTDRGGRAAPFTGWRDEPTASLVDPLSACTDCSWCRPDSALLGGLLAPSSTYIADVFLLTFEAGLMASMFRNVIVHSMSSPAKKTLSLKSTNTRMLELTVAIALRTALLALSLC